MIIITGGSGFIGTNLKCCLRRASDEQIVSLDVVDPPFTIDGVVERKMDVAKIHEWSSSDHLSTIYHLAAQPGVADTDHRRMIKNNINATVAVGEWAARYGAHMVHASSCGVGAVPGSYENDPSNFGSTSGYAITKQACEHYLQMMVAQIGLSCSILRFSNVYGWQPKPKSCVSAFMKAAMDRSTVRMTGNGLQTRDLIHVYDVVQAMGAAARDRYYGQPLEICTGEHTSMRRLWKLCQVVAQTNNYRYRKPSFVQDFAGPDMVPGSPDAAKDCLGWEPEGKITDGLILQHAYMADRCEKHGPELIDEIWRICTERGLLPRAVQLSRTGSI